MVQSLGIRNSLPRSVSSLLSLRSKLKTHRFQLAYRHGWILMSTEQMDFDRAKLYYNSQLRLTLEATFDCWLVHYYNHTIEVMISY